MSDNHAAVARLITIIAWEYSNMKHQGSKPRKSILICSDVKDADAPLKGNNQLFRQLSTVMNPHTTECKGLRSPGDVLITTSHQDGNFRWRHKGKEAVQYASAGKYRRMYTILPCNMLATVNDRRPGRPEPKLADAAQDTNCCCLTWSRDRSKLYSRCSVFVK